MDGNNGDLIGCSPIESRGSNRRISRQSASCWRRHFNLWRQHRCLISVWSCDHKTLISDSVRQDRTWTGSRLPGRRHSDTGRPTNSAEPNVSFCKMTVCDWKHEMSATNDSFTYEYVKIDNEPTLNTTRWCYFILLATSLTLGSVILSLIRLLVYCL